MSMWGLWSKLQMDQKNTSVKGEGTMRDDDHPNQPSVEDFKLAAKEPGREVRHAEEFDQDINRKKSESRNSYEGANDQSKRNKEKAKLESLTGTNSSIVASDTYRQEREAAKLALGNLHHAPAIDQQSPIVVSDTYRQEKEAAKLALGKLHHAPAVDQQSSIVASDTYRQEREAAKLALGTLHHAPAVDPDVNLKHSSPSSPYKNGTEKLNHASHETPSTTAVSGCTPRARLPANHNKQVNNKDIILQHAPAHAQKPAPDYAECEDSISTGIVNPGAFRVGDSDDISTFTPIQPPMTETEKPWTYVVAHAVTESKDIERGASEVVMAEQMPESTESNKICGMSRKAFFFVLLLSILIVVVGYTFFHLLFFRKQSPSVTPTAPPTKESPKLHIFNEPVLKTAKERGFLRCFGNEVEVFEGKGFSLDVCYAIAAAIFDDPSGALDRVEFIHMPFREQFGALWDGTIDVSTGFTTHNMRRDIFEPSAELPISFSTPYVHSGMLFIGIPEFVDCADRHDSLVGLCRGLSVCVKAATTLADVVDSILPGITVHHVQSNLDFSESFVNRKCTVIATEPVLWKSIESQVIELGYVGEFNIGKKLHSFEPLAIATKGDDEEWSHFCNWILQALITAEAVNITQEVALSSSLWSLNTTSWREKFPETTSIFGDEYKNMFRNAIAAVGHYGEVYERKLEQTFPRDGAGRLNSINVDDTGLLYPYPFGVLTVDDSDFSSTDSPRPGPISNGTLEAIVDRGVLRCGVIGNQRIYAKLQFEVDNETMTIDNHEQWTGIDVEYCRAISSAIFPDTMLSANHQDDSVVFVDIGTNVQNGYIALDNDEIDVFAGGSISITADIKDTVTGKGYTFTPPYYYYHDDNDFLYEDNNDSEYNIDMGRSLVTRDTDKQWSSFVRWITTAIVYADHQEITQEGAFDMPVVELFGPEFKQMFQDAILTVGNYDELFHRTMTEPFNISRIGRNLVNTDGGPQFLALSLL